MPAEDRIRREQRAELLQQFAAQSLSLDSQPSALGIGQQDSLVAEFLFPNCVLAAEVLNDLLLLSIDPTGKDQQE